MERGHVGATGGPSGSASQSGCVQFCKFIRLNIYDLCIFLDIRQTSIKFAEKPLIYSRREISQVGT